MDFWNEDMKTAPNEEWVLCAVKLEPDDPDSRAVPDVALFDSGFWMNVGGIVIDPIAWAQIGDTSDLDGKRQPIAFSPFEPEDVDEAYTMALVGSRWYCSHSERGKGLTIAICDDKDAAINALSDLVDGHEPITAA